MGQIQISGVPQKDTPACRCAPMAVPSHGAPAPAAHAATPVTPNFSFETRALHADGHNKPLNAHAWPIFQTSTFMFDSPDHGADLFAGRTEGHIYSRVGNPTVEAFERIMANLEEGAGAVAFGSGLAAVTGCTLPFLRKDDPIILGDTMYGPSLSLVCNYYTRWGITPVIVDTSDVHKVEQALRENPKTKMIYLESPANPTNKISDIQAISERAHAVGALVAVDSTFVTPYFQRPLCLGADIVLHSVTKYLNGHGDVVGGVAVAKSADNFKIIKTWRKDTGAIMSPLDAFLVMRGLRTLSIRMEQLNKNALVVARWLRAHPDVETVMHPSFEDFPNHDIAVRQMTGFGSTFSFTLKAGFAAAKALLENVHIMVVAVSLGGVDTLIEHPASMTHCGVPEDLMRQQGLTPSLVRISVGLENPDEIIADLAHAFEAIKKN